MVVPHPSWTEGGGPGMAGCILLSHEGFVDHAREMKEATFVDLAFTRTAIFFSRKETQVKHSQVLTEPPRQFPPPQSSGWNPLQLNNFLHLASIPHPLTPLLHHRLAPLASVTTPQRVAAPSRMDRSMALVRDIIWKCQKMRARARKLWALIYFSCGASHLMFCLLCCSNETATLISIFLKVMRIQSWLGSGCGFWDDCSKL